MRRIITTFVVALAALALSSPALAAAPTLFGGATVEGGSIKLVSNLSNATSADDFSGIDFSDDIPFDQLRVLAAQYNVTDDDCGAGSPRFQLNVDGKNVFVYFGPTPSFTGCQQNTWLSTGNLIGSTDARWDLSQLGGPHNATYEQARQLLAGKVVTGIQLVVDSGWFFADREQTVLVRNVIVNRTLFGGTVTNGRLNPAKTCKAWRMAMGDTLFRQTFGENANGRNAFGKCVSTVAKAKRNGSIAVFHVAVLNAVSSCKATGATGAALRTCVRDQLRGIFTVTRTSVATSGKGKGKGKGKP